MMPHSDERAFFHHIPASGSPVRIHDCSPRMVFTDSVTYEGRSGLPPAEWWFVHGWYGENDIARRYFMCTFFRFSLPGEEMEKPLCHLLLSDLDPATGANATSSRADPGIPGWIDRSIGSDLDQDLVVAYREELRESGVFPPIVTGTAVPSVTPDPFDLRWGDFAVSSKNPCSSLVFRRPGDGKECRFLLEPSAPAWYSPGFPVGDREEMAYASVPLMKIQGSAGDSPVSGEAWADHQWGGLGWFGHPAGAEGDGRPRISGWDWYAVSLESGIHLMAIVHRDMADRRIRAQWCLVLFPDGKRHVFQEFSLVHSRYWTSTRTGITYPLSAEISFPGCRLAITPLIPDQELPIPGPMRAVWEGAAGVGGTWNDRPVTGTARVELCGYGYIFDFNEVLASIGGRIDAELNRSLPRTLDGAGIGRLIGSDDWQGEPRVYPDLIAGPAWELIGRDKKFYRPLYAVLLLHALGAESGPYMDLLCAVPELTHTGALIIDDIEDSSLIRRGGPCIHRMYGTETAINAANTLYYLPWLRVGHHPMLDDSQRLELYRNMVKSAVRAHIGQGADLWLSHQRDPERLLAWVGSGMDEKILQMHADKTGIAGEQVATGCCVITHASEETREACVRYSKDLWVAFQIMDDIRDITGGNAKARGPGEDIASGKVSYVIARALMMLDDNEKRRLAGILSLAPAEKDPRVVEEGLSLVRKSGAVEACRKEVEERHARAWRGFSPCIPASEAKVMLRAFSKKMLRE